MCFLGTKRRPGRWLGSAAGSKRGKSPRKKLRGVDGGEQLGGVRRGQLQGTEPAEAARRGRADLCALATRRTSYSSTREIRGEVPL